MHYELMKQTQYKLQIVFDKHCLHMTLKREADRHHLFDIVLEKVFRVGGHCGTTGSACPNVLLSVKIMKAPAKQPPFSQPLSDRFATSSRTAVLEWITCIMHAYDVYVA